MCIFHGTSGHHTSKCQKLRLTRAKQFSKRPGRGDKSPACRGGHGGGRWDDRVPRQEWCEQPHEDRWRGQPQEDHWHDDPREGQRHGQPCEVRPREAGLPPLPPPSRRRDDDRQHDGAGGFQEVTMVASILGGAQTPTSNLAFKQFVLGLNAALPRPEAMRPLNWSQTTITFDPGDQLRCSFMAGKLPMMCIPTICNVLVTKTLMESGTGLNVLSVETFEKL
ncbi:hypothetical protein ZWY2020_014621 [Hordeum vulgare]|nr:hypothetical protein ZWY2020_014621 [Hordeum vulgare]